ncbi:hypothetical protein VV38_02205 [Clavibacter nebraskensis]|nr:hypothetical protein VV38_02205 [Clavibacter nebraskensis]OAH22529.1 hypothetical protein A3Q38_01015 [Clavibacter nebraskensis]
MVSATRVRPKIPSATSTALSTATPAIVHRDDARRTSAAATPMTGPATRPTGIHMEWSGSARKCPRHRLTAP